MEWTRLHGLTARLLCTPSSHQADVYGQKGCFSLQFWLRTSKDRLSLLHQGHQTTTGCLAASCTACPGRQKTRFPPTDNDPLGLK